MFCVVLILIFFGYYLLQKWWTVGNIAKKSVFITGCDSGFGKLLAIKCAKKGMQVFAGCLTEKGEDELKKAGGDCLDRLNTIPLDVTSDKSVENAVAILESKLGADGLWGLVNNAGRAGPMGGDDFYNVQDYQTCLDVNALGVVRVVQGFKHLVKKTRGRIVAVTSIFGRIPGFGNGPYAMSKYALEGYCDVIRMELKFYGVSVHILEPGGFKTDMMTPDLYIKALNNVWDRASPHIRTEYGQQFKDKLTEITKSMGQGASGRLDYVVDAYWHALTARLPQNRYWVGWDAMCLLGPISTLPTFLMDVALVKLYDWMGYPKPNNIAL